MKTTSLRKLAESALAIYDGQLKWQGYAASSTRLFSGRVGDFQMREMLWGTAQVGVNRRATGSPWRFDGQGGPF